MPYNAYIVDCVRTAGGRKGGRISHIHAIDLGAEVLNALVDRNRLDGALVDDVIFGCVDQVGAQAGNIARMSVLASKLPECVPGTTVDRQCGSSQQAIHFAVQAVMSGTQDVVIAGGVESMSQVPIGANVRDGYKEGHGMPMTDKMRAKYPVPQFSQFEGAEIVAEKFNVSKEEMASLAATSHQRAVAATKAGFFKREIVPIEGIDTKTSQKVVHDTDEGIRENVSVPQMLSLKPLKAGGRITAATSSQICDGAAAILICNEAGLKKLGLKPRAKFVSLALAGTDPIMMLAGPIPATKTALAKANLSINDIDLYEVNEAFASVPLAWAKEVGADLNKLNVNGGAMALGHPLGATGAKLMTTLLCELERRGGRFGLQAICEGGGTANATIIERIPSTAPIARL
eukprot:TRINITY_DN644_c0_g1_i1.p1 TRINITY_DN644_c0_g1~~TRINITY_DN644_c0_g1_i1.p1  ORF type:complete len:402 (+),score=97.79 TRINITY_DN644_c0_g1_i1:96-1301(+)